MAKRTFARVAGILLVAFGGVALLSPAAATQAARYFPPEGWWETRAPADVGLDKAKLDAAIAFAVANQATSSRNLAEATPRQFQSEAPYNNLIGPTQERAGMSGLIIRRGYVAAGWGDTFRADMTFSVTKTFLSTVVGEAFERGLIKDVNDKVAPYMPAGVDLFTSAHNAKITWDHLLRQTSDWSGTLWGKPEWADRPQNCLGRGVPVPTIEHCKDRPLQEPGTVYKYNDTRVNVLALATLYVMKEPLPVVLEREIMDPIGASSTWHWEPYDNAYVTIEGKRMPSIPGGGHHGGGMFISAWDMARFGYLFLNNGKWGDRQLVTDKWIAMAKAPGTANKEYGFMNWFLNAPSTPAGGGPGRMMYPAAPQSAVAFRGNGENIIYIDWQNDMVVILRWSGRTAQVIEQILAAVQK